MTRRREPHPLQKVTLNLFEGDWDQLTHMHGHMEASRAVRRLVRKHIEMVQLRANKQKKALK